MVMTATDIYERLREDDADKQVGFTLSDNVGESDVRSWYESVDVGGIRDSVRANYDTTVVTDLSKTHDIGVGGVSVNDVIKSRGDDPSQFDAAYIISGSKDVVQYFPPWESGKAPIGDNEVSDVLDSHLNNLVERQVNSEVVRRAKVEFGV